jgi:hypothetical protein
VTFLTLERTQMHRWTRKRRLKFRKRWRKQHGGYNFCWMIAEFKHAAIKPCAKEMERVILFKRQPQSTTP